MTAAAKGTLKEMSARTRKEAGLIAEQGEDLSELDRRLEAATRVPAAEVARAGHHRSLGARTGPRPLHQRRAAS